MDSMDTGELGLAAPDQGDAEMGGPDALGKVDGSAGRIGLGPTGPDVSTTNLLIPSEAPKRQWDSTAHPPRTS